VRNYIPPSRVRRIAALSVEIEILRNRIEDMTAARPRLDATVERLGQGAGAGGMTRGALGVTVRYKDYRRDGPQRQRVMTLAPHEFIRRFLLHVLPRGFHRIRHYGLLASSARKASSARELLVVAPPPEPVASPEPLDHLPPCPCCGGRMIIIETFERWRQSRAPPHAPIPTGSVPS
jgi:hypothetical protein